MAKPKTLKMSDIKQTGGSKRRTGVQNFADIVPQEENKHFQDMADQTIYIVKLERREGTQYGNGYVVSFKDLPNARDTYTTGVFGEYPTKQLDSLFAMTHEGRTISLDSPVKTTIRQAGKTYKFE